MKFKICKLIVTDPLVGVLPSVQGNVMSVAVLVDPEHHGRVSFALSL